jgi:hypothetical protein
MDKRNSTKLSSSTVGILAVAALVGVVGLYTENSGFVLAGAIFLVVGVILGLNQIRSRD